MRRRLHPRTYLMFVQAFNLKNPPPPAQRTPLVTDYRKQGDEQRTKAVCSNHRPLCVALRTIYVDVYYRL